MNVVVIGGGASGMMSAIFAASCGASVTILEKKEQLGKKLSVTGNGKCNYGNLYMAPKYYRGHDLSIMNTVLRRVPQESMINWFESVGMLSFSKKNYLYPASQSAQTVILTLKKCLSERNVNVVLDCTVTAVKKAETFEISTNQGNFTADRVILACGSMSGVKDPVPFNGYELLESFGHYVYPPIPSLVPLVGSMGIEEFWDGVRTQAMVSFRDLSEEGEIQLTKNGLSGIPVFQLSHKVGEEVSKRPVFVNVDFIPNYDRDSLVEFVKELRESPRAKETGFDALLLWLPKKLCVALSKTDPELFRKELGEYTDGDASKLVSIVKAFSYRVTGTGDFLQSQVTNGGADTTEFSDTMESKLVPGLFVTGEMLDIDGVCGGYNLHFAFATGKIAGEEAGR